MLTFKRLATGHNWTEPELDQFESQNLSWVTWSYETYMNNYPTRLCWVHVTTSLFLSLSLSLWLP